MRFIISCYCISKKGGKHISSMHIVSMISTWRADTKDTLSVDTINVFYSSIIAPATRSMLHPSLGCLRVSLSQNDVHVGASVWIWKCLLCLWGDALKKKHASHGGERDKCYVTTHSPTTDALRRMMGQLLSWHCKILSFLICHWCLTDIWLTLSLSDI
jgi:hypothetical protein